MFANFVATDQPKPNMLTEARAGFTTWLTMVYIVFVNPAILSKTGMPAEDVAIATALSAAIGTFLTGWLSKYPFAQAPGMGINAYFAFTVVLGMGVDWKVALGAVFWEGVIFVILSHLGLRDALIRTIPMGLKHATAGGIGLFLAMIGLQNAQVIKDSPATLVTLGSLTEPKTAIFFAGLLIGGALMVRRSSLASIAAIAVSLGLGYFFGVVPVPDSVFSWPRLPSATLFAFDFWGLFRWDLIPVVLTFLFVDIFDTAGTLYGVGRLGGFVDKSGQLPRAKQAFLADAWATVIGAVLGTSTVTTFVESAAGVQAGGRTGQASLVTAGLFLLTLGFIPLAASVPLFATAPALVLVGASMIAALSHVDWQDPGEALPAFLTAVLMPLTFSIATGLSFGIIAYVAIRLVAGRHKQLNLGLVGLAGLLLIHFII